MVTVTVVIMAVTIPVTIFPAPTPIIPGADTSSRMISPTPTPIVVRAIFGMSQIGHTGDNHECK
jgi:hypothetical protein